MLHAAHCGGILHHAEPAIPSRSSRLGWGGLPPPIRVRPIPVTKAKVRESGARDTRPQAPAKTNVRGSRSQRSGARPAVRVCRAGNRPYLPSLHRRSGGRSDSGRSAGVAGGPPHNCPTFYFLIGRSLGLTGLAAEIAIEGHRFIAESPSAIMLPPGFAHHHRLIEGGGWSFHVNVRPGYEESLMPAARDDSPAALHVNRLYQRAGSRRPEHHKLAPPGHRETGRVL
jgi:hypothetical protein